MTKQNMMAGRTGPDMTGTAPVVRPAGGSASGAVAASHGAGGGANGASRPSAEYAASRQGASRTTARTGSGQARTSAAQGRAGTAASARPTAGSGTARGARSAQTTRTAQSARTSTGASAAATGRRTSRRPAQNQAGNGKLQIIPLGGLGEIGKNMTAIMYGSDMFVIDAGLAFPGEEMLGIDIVIPDITFLLENREKLRGIVLTHGHEDHIGGLPYVLKQLDTPIYGTRLTLGLVEGKLAEHGLKLPDRSRIVKAGDELNLGAFTVGFMRVNHSIPDSVGLYVRTPIGTIVHTGDFKIDHTPIDNEPMDLAKFAELGNEGVLVLMSDSTNAERKGYTPSERVVGQTILEVVARARQRTFVATFASNVHRIQQVFDAAHQTGKKVAVLGRSMENVVEVSARLGYLKLTENTLISLDDTERYPADRIIILCTGSQGEPMAALSRMAVSEHKRMEILPGDTVLIAATPIPGNEVSVARTISNLYRRGAEVIYGGQNGVHVSGHASQEELKTVLNLVRPRYFIPVHGEYKMLVNHAHLGMQMGITSDRILIADNGDVLEITPERATIAGRVQAGVVMVDGLGVGDVGNIVIRDRQQLSQDGILIVVMAMDKENGHLVGGPDVVTRGFVYVRESEKLLDEARDRVKAAIDEAGQRGVSDWSAIKTNVRDALGKLLYERTRRRPMILPIIIEV